MKKRFQMTTDCHISVNTTAKETSATNGTDLDEQSCQMEIRTKVITKMASDMAKEFTGKLRGNVASIS